MLESQPVNLSGLARYGVREKAQASIGHMGEAINLVESQDQKTSLYQIKYFFSKLYRGVRHLVQRMRR
jgi:hypothetical protein